ncbi:MAG: YbaK/EbsC family protein [Clostridiaceae bacterium]
MSEGQSSSARRLEYALSKHNLELRIVDLSDSARTSQEAADKLGCELPQIASSTLFRGKESKTPILVITSGNNHVNERKIKSIIGEKLEKPDMEFIMEETGFDAESIPPVGHHKDIVTFIDEDLMDYKVIWVETGDPDSLFCLTPKELLEITNGEIIDLK